MDILQMLKKEHKEATSMINKLIKTKQIGRVQKNLFKELNKNIMVHADFEEEIFYPEVIKVNKSLILEGYEEHHVVRILLSELQKLPMEDETWIPKMKVLKENFKHHYEEEEEELFPKVKTKFKNDLKQIGEEYLRFKKQNGF